MYDNLFRDWNGIVSVRNVSDIPDGGQLSDGALLAKIHDDPAYYLVTNGQKRRITSLAAMGRYYFDWRKVGSYSRA
jgi:hypothetical protein